MKVLQKIETGLGKKEFLLLSSNSVEDSKIILHIFVDNVKGEFTAKKVKLIEPIDESLWKIQKGYTFPSSIFYEFIKEKRLDETL